jgi:tetratricopeptide (TPR) repeat protein
MVVFSAALFAPAPLRAETGDERRALSLHYYRGIVCFEAGQYDSALTEFRSVAEIDPQYKNVQKYLDKTMEILEVDRADALGVSQAVVREGGDDLLYAGKAFFEKGDYRRAGEAFKSILVRNPKDKFALHYLKLCEEALGGKIETAAKTAGPAYVADEPAILEKSVAYLKDDLEEQQGQMVFYEKKAERRFQRDEMIRKKEKELEQQEALLAEEREDYLAQVRLSQKAKRISKESEKWRTMKERLESKEPGIATDLTEYPVFINRAQQYYANMEVALRASRWHSAGLNAIGATVTYCDALLIYFYGVKSAHPAHGNITRLLREHVRRSDAAEHIEHLRALLNLQLLVQDEARPINRSEALFLTDKAKKVVEWCRTLLP